MFNKKIFTSALIGTLAFGLFPTNIFANSNQLAIEKKICENMENLRYIKIKNDNFYFSFEGDILGNANYNYYVNLEKKDFYSFPIINMEDENVEIENNIIKINGKEFKTRDLKDNEQVYFIKKIGDDIYYKILYANHAFGKGELYKNNEKITDVEYTRVVNSFSIDNNGNIYFIETKNLGLIDAGLSKIDSTVYKISNGKKEKVEGIKELKNIDFYYSDSDGGHYGRLYEIFNLNNDIYLVDYNHGYNKDFSIYKNGKSLCENLENNTNNNGNSGNNNSSLGNSGPSAEAIASMIKKDDRVKTENSEKTKKEKEIRKKVYNKLKEVSEVNSMRGFDLAFGDLYVNENYYSKDKDGKIIYSDSKAEEKIRILNSIGTFFSENSYEVVKKVHEKFNEEETRSLASESEFVKDFIYEFEKKFDELETKIDSIAYKLPAENVKKIKERIRNFANKYFKGDYSNTFFTRVYEILQNDRNIKNQAETSNEIFFAINVISNEILSQIGKYEINWVKDKNIEMGITGSKRSEIYNSIK